MAENHVPSQINDAVCIDAGRVYDSCMDRDCLEGLRVYFNQQGQAAIQNAVSARVKCAKVCDVQINVEPVSFNRGFFSCDLTFYFTVECEVTTAPCQGPMLFTGIAVYSKKVILCGSEGSVRRFSSTGENNAANSNLPKCVVECVDPVVLDSCICEKCCCEHPAPFPRSVAAYVDGDIHINGDRALYVTLGLFSIVQLIRNVQMLIPVYDFCVPQKECPTTTANPCDLFSKISFPTDEFFPPVDMCKPDCCCDEQDA